ncbi:MAG: M1 family metallopeptidase, partial [Planctomycetota bacterium]
HLPVVAPFQAMEPFRVAEDRPVDIKHIRLTLELFLEEKRISGSAAIRFIPLREISSLRLDAVGHEVSKIRDASSQQELKFENTGKELVIELGAAKPGQEKEILIDYQVREPKAGLYFFAPTERDPKIPLMAWSQGEPISNRYWFPCLDHPNERQTTEIIATAPVGFEVLSNGTLVGQDKLDGGKVRFHWKQSEPHVAYLVTLVVGRFAIGREEWRGRPVAYYAPPERASDINRTFGRTIEMLDFFSQRFGIEYPWDKYAQVVVEQFIAGGMENTTATTLYSRVMHDERAMLDSSPDWLIAHELAHQWWGDLLTCKDWAHLWLNEGFATYSEALWAEHKLGKEEFDFSMYEKGEGARSGGATSRPVVDRHYADPQTMFDTRAYPKGAWILHMLRRLLGEEVFFQGIAAYGKNFRQQTVETADLRMILERHSGRSLERFFYDWTERPGHPELEVESSFDPESKATKIAVRQKQKHDPFHFPLKIVLDLGEGREPVQIVKEIRDRELIFYVPTPTAAELVRVDPDQGLLADIKEKKSRDGWKRQALSAPTVVERIRAVKHFGESKDAQDRELLATVLKEDKFHGVQIEAARALGMSGGDMSRDGLLIGLASEHPKVRRACAEALGKFVHDPLVANSLEEKMKKGDESYFVQAAAIQAYAAIALKPSLDAFVPALERESHGETIRLAALRGIAYCDDPKAIDLLVPAGQPGKPALSRWPFLLGDRDAGTWTRRSNPGRRCRGSVPDERTAEGRLRHQGTSRHGKVRRPGDAVLDLSFRSRIRNSRSRPRRRRRPRKIPSRAKQRWNWVDFGRNSSVFAKRAKASRSIAQNRRQVLSLLATREICRGVKRPGSRRCRDQFLLPVGGVGASFCTENVRVPSLIAAQKSNVGARY